MKHSHNTNKRKQPNKPSQNTMPQNVDTTENRPTETFELNNNLRMLADNHLLNQPNSSKYLNYTLSHTNQTALSSMFCLLIANTLFKNDNFDQLMKYDHIFFNKDEECDTLWDKILKKNPLAFKQGQFNRIISLGNSKSPGHYKILAHVHQYILPNKLEIVDLTNQRTGLSPKKTGGIGSETRDALSQYFDKKAAQSCSPEQIKPQTNKRPAKREELKDIPQHKRAKRIKPATQNTSNQPEQIQEKETIVTANSQNLPPVGSRFPILTENDLDRIKFFKRSTIPISCLINEPGENKKISISSMLN